MLKASQIFMRVDQRLIEFAALREAVEIANGKPMLPICIFWRQRHRLAEQVARLSKLGPLRGFLAEMIKYVGITGTLLQILPKQARIAMGLGFQLRLEISVMLDIKLDLQARQI